MILALIPVFNEASKIGTVIHDILPHVDRVVVIDDGSSDGTGEEAIRAGATVLTHEINRGQGAALETGHVFARATGASYVVHFDGDGQFMGSDVPLALAHLKQENADILFGSRFLGADSNIPLLKKAVILPLAKRFDRLFGAPELSDAHNGFRILSRPALDAIVLTQDRMAHASEIPSLVKKRGLSYVEYPVTVRYSEFGQGATGGLKVLRDLVFGYFV